MLGGKIAKIDGFGMETCSAIGITRTPFRCPPLFFPRSQDFLRLNHCNFRMNQPGPDPRREKNTLPETNEGQGQYGAGLVLGETT